MRSALFLSLLPLALGCDNPANDACAAAYTASRSAADAFCATFTTGTVTATTDLPSFASACDNNIKHLSSACSCIDTAWATAAAGEASSNEPATTSEVATSVSFATSEVIPTSSAAVTKPTTLVKVTRSAQASVTAAPVVADSQASGTGTTCVVTAYASISSAVESCTNIVLSNISAPPSSTIDLQSLQTGATVTFAGTTVGFLDRVLLATY